MPAGKLSNSPFPSPERLVLSFTEGSRRAKEGQILVLALILLVVVMIISAAMFSKVTTFLHSGSQFIQWEQATVIADAGADYAVFKLNSTQGYSGNPAINLGIGAFKIDIQDVGSNKKITSTGCIPNCTNAKVKRVVKVEVVKITTTTGTLPDTGQTTCDPSPCTGSGQDADYTPRQTLQPAIHPLATMAMELSLTTVLALPGRSAQGVRIH